MVDVVDVDVEVEGSVYGMEIEVVSGRCGGGSRVEWVEVELAVQYSSRCGDEAGYRQCSTVRQTTVDGVDE